MCPERGQPIVACPASAGWLDTLQAFAAARLGRLRPSWGHMRRPPTLATRSHEGTVKLKAGQVHEVWPLQSILALVGCVLDTLPCLRRFAHVATIVQHFLGRPPAPTLPWSTALGSAGKRVSDTRPRTVLRSASPARVARHDRSWHVKVLVGPAAPDAWIRILYRGCVSAHKPSRMGGIPPEV